MRVAHWLEKTVLVAPKIASAQKLKVMTVTYKDISANHWSIVSLNRPNVNLQKVNS